MIEANEISSNVQPEILEAQERFNEIYNSIQEDPAAAGMN